MSFDRVSISKDRIATDNRYFRFGIQEDELVQILYNSTNDIMFENILSFSAFAAYTTIEAMRSKLKYFLFACIFQLKFAVNAKYTIYSVSNRCFGHCSAVEVFGKTKFLH